MGFFFKVFKEDAVYAMNGGENEPVIDVIERGNANADAGLPDQVADLFLQLGKRFYVVEGFELEQTGLYII